MIRLEQVSKYFPGTTALENVSLSILPGQCIGLIGPNACGKTTLIKCILSMVFPTTGEIYFDDKSINGEVEYKKRIGYMPQIGRYPENMTIQQVFNMLRGIRGGIGSEDLELWENYQLEKIKNKKMGVLSGGTMQKVSASLAFLFCPDVLILDEPTAGLDPLATEILRDKIVQEREKGKLIIITSHVLSELDDLITDVVFMQEAKLLFYQPIQELFALTSETRASRAIAKLLKSNT